MGQVSAATGVLRLLLGILTAEYFYCTLVFLITANGWIQLNPLLLLQTTTISRNRWPSERSIADQAFNQSTNEPTETNSQTNNGPNNQQTNQPTTNRARHRRSDWRIEWPTGKPTTNNQSTKQPSNQAVM